MPLNALQRLPTRQREVLALRYYTLAVHDTDPSGKGTGTFQDTKDITITSRPPTRRERTRDTRRPGANAHAKPADPAPTHARDPPTRRECRWGGLRSPRGAESADP